MSKKETVIFLILLM